MAAWVWRPRAARHTRPSGQRRRLHGASPAVRQAGGARTDAAGPGPGRTDRALAQHRRPRQLTGPDSPSPPPMSAPPMRRTAAATRRPAAVVPARLAGAFHDYVITWSPHGFSVAVDGRTLYQDDTSFDRPRWLGISLAATGRAATGAQLLVEKVVAFRWTGPARARRRYRPRRRELDTGRARRHPPQRPLADRRRVHGCRRPRRSGSGGAGRPTTPAPRAVRGALLRAG